MFFSKTTKKVVISSSLTIFLAGCGAPNYSPSEFHITAEKVQAEAPKDTSSIPALVKATPTIPVISNQKDSDTFDVVVTNVPVRDLLFALARDSGVNLDIDASVGGLITMSALDQTLDAILERIAVQVPIRVDRVGNALIVKNDEPYFKRYHVEYTSVTRAYSSSASTGGVVGGSDSSVENSADNSFWEDFEGSIEAILDAGALTQGEESGAVAGAIGEGEENEALIAINESEASLGEKEENSFNFNLATGILIVYAPERLQREIQAYLDESLAVIRRQVLLEATIVEVVLNNDYRQGIDWAAFNQFATEGLALSQGSILGGSVAAIQQVLQEFEETNTQFFGTTPDADSTSDITDTTAYNRFISRSSLNLNESESLTDFEIESEAVTNDDGEVIGYNVTRTATTQRVNEAATRRTSGGLAPVSPGITDPAFSATFRKGDVSAAVQLLDRFGDAKVLSSPRISVLNNQPALLRVADQEVYFSIDVDESINEDTGAVTERTYDVTENTVDIGFVMNVLPHITADGEIFLNLKPSVTRVVDYRRAPTPTAVGGNSGSVQNLVPITRVRELESVMALRDGEIAVMGGLLEDRVGDSNSSVPGLSRLPGIGTLFQNKQETTFKTEFVVFIKARIIKNPSIYGDYSDYQELLPDSDFIIRDRVDTGLPSKQKKSR